MPWGFQHLGPLNFHFGRDAVRYLSGSPTAADRKCLEAFFRDLQQTSTKVQKVRVGNALWVVACNHIVVFSGNLRRVIDVLPV